MIVEKGNFFALVEAVKYVGFAREDLVIHNLERAREALASAQAHIDWIIDQQQED